MDTAAMLLAGVVFAGAGGELFVRGAVGLAAWARVPAAIVAVTVAAFATSSPELLVGITAAAQDRSAVSFGDAVGSNVVNVALVLAIAIVIRPAPIDRESARRDLPVALAVPLVTLVLVADGRMSRLDGALLLAGFALWLGVTVRHARRARRRATEVTAAEVLGARGRAGAVAAAVAGLGLLVLAGRLIVVGAESIGAALGLDQFVVGATLVAVGTSAPELATALVAGLRGHEEVGVGNVVGSNIFNGLWIVAVVALLRPFDVSVGEVALGLGVGVLSVAMIVPGPSLRLGRVRGVLLLTLYGLYLTGLLVVRPGQPPGE